MENKRTHVLNQTSNTELKKRLNHLSNGEEFNKYIF